MINQVTLGARVVSDIELRKTNKKGVSVVDFRVMHQDRKLANALFIDVEVWGSEAQRVSERIKRGDNILIIGELRRDVWTSKNAETGESENRSKIKITAHRITLSDLSRPRSESEVSLDDNLPGEDAF